MVEGRSATRGKSGQQDVVKSSAKLCPTRGIDLVRTMRLLNTPRGSDMVSVLPVQEHVNLLVLPDALTVWQLVGGVQIEVTPASRTR